LAEERLHALVRFGVALTGNRERAEDLVQTALERTLRGWHRIRDPERAEAYVRRAMVNLHINAGRRRGRELQFGDDFDVLEVADPHPAPDLADRDALTRALASLPPGQRAVLVLRYYEDQSVAEIAEMLGCSPGTVKSQASRAIAKLRLVVDGPLTASEVG
jgi:RNA polymerase sigma-70 factor (sigma-E family)